MWALIDTCRASTAQWRAICTIGKFQNSVRCYILSLGMCSCGSGVLSAPLVNFRIQWRAIFFQPVCVHVSVACYLHHWYVSEFSDVLYSFSRYVFMCQWRAICTIGKFQNSVTCNNLSAGMYSCVSGVLSAPLVSFRNQWRAIFFQSVCVYVSVACYLHHWQVSEFSDVLYSFSRYVFMCQWRAICTNGKFQNSMTRYILSAGMYSCVSGVLSAPLASFRIQWRTIFFQPIYVHVSVACYLHHWQVSEFSNVLYSFSRYVFMCQWRAICTTGKFQNKDSAPWSK